MRILQVHNSYREAGGEDRVVEAQRGLLRQAGHTVDILSDENPDGVASSALALLAAPWNPAAAVRASRRARSLRPDVAHVHNTWFALSPSVVWSLSRSAPVVLTLHNYRLTCANALLFRDGSPCQLCVGQDPWPAIEFKCYRDSAAQSAVAAATIAVNRRLETWLAAERILVVSEFAREMMIRSGLPAAKIETHPNFVDDPGERHTPPSDSEFVLFVGRLSYEKGADLLLEAWREWNPEGLKLVIVGDGPQHATLEAAEVAGVEFLGKRPITQVKELMKGARALVFPSRVFEGQPMVITEALAAGLPIVATEQPNLRQILGGAGIHTKILQSQDFARTLEKLEDDSMIDDIGRSSRSHYLANYAPGQALDRLEAVYRSVAGTGAA